MARFVCEAKCRWMSVSLVFALVVGSLRAEPEEKPSAGRAVDDVGPAFENLPKGAIARLGSIRLCHTDAVRTVRFVDGDEAILSVGVDRRVCRWERTSGRLLRETWTDPAIGYAQSCAALEDGGVEIGTDAGCVVRFDSTGATIGEPLRFESTRFVEVSPRGAFVAVASAQVADVDLRDAEGNSVTRLEPEGVDQIVGVAFSRDETKLAVSGWVRETRHTGTAVILVVDTATGEVALDARIPETLVTKAAFSPDGAHVALGDRAGAVRVLDVATGVISEPTQKHPRGVFALEYSDDGAWIASGGGEGSVQVFDGKTGEWIHGFDAHRMSVSDLDFSDDGEHLVTASYDSRVRVFSVATGESEFDAPGHLSPVSSATFVSNGALIVTGGYDSTVRVWDAESYEQIRVIAHGAGFVNDVVAVGDASSVFVVGQDGVLRRVDVRTGEEAYAVRDSEMALFDVEVSPNGKRVATASADGQVRVHDVETGRPLLRFDAGPGFTFALAYSPDGKRIAAGTSMIKLFDAETGGLVRDFEEPKAPVSGLLFAGPDRIVSCGADRMIRVWDPETGKAVAELEGHPSRVSRIALAPDGNTIVSCGFGETVVRLWDLSKPSAGSRTVDGHSKNVLAVAFDPNGKRIVSGAMDALAYVWECP